MGRLIFKDLRGLFRIDKENYRKEHAEVNRGKRGKQYKYTTNIIRTVAFLSIFLPFRQIAGALEVITGMDVDYSALFKRVKKEKLKWKLRESHGRLIFWLSEELKKGEYFIEGMLKPAGVCIHYAGEKNVRCSGYT